MEDENKAVSAYLMTDDERIEYIRGLQRHLRDIKIVCGILLIGIFIMIYQVFAYKHMKIGISWLALLAGIMLLAWGIYDHFKYIRNGEY